MACGPPNATPVREGWLGKRGPLPGWSFDRRWCTLRAAGTRGGACLGVYDEATLCTLRAEIPIGPEATVVPFTCADRETGGEEAAAMAQERPYGFVIEVCEATKVSYHYFEAGCFNSLTSWISAFREIGATAIQPVQGAQHRGSVDVAALPYAPKRQISGEEAKYVVDMETPLTVVIFGATGDLAKKKLYPALYQLMFGCPDAPLLPQTCRVVGYARSKMELSAFLTKQCVNVNGEHRDRFLEQCEYFIGGYDDPEDYGKLHDFLRRLEGGGKANRMFFFSVNPQVFAAICTRVKEKACAPDGGFTRLIIEKPFGRDSASFAELDRATSSCFPEESLYRIDHYLGKEVVLNLVSLRFGNQLFEPLWNNKSIEHVQIVFKEDLGTGGRGGYFDEFGIIRDIMQNHLLQVFLWLAMEPPETLDRKHVMDAKCKLLKATRTLELKDVFLGQFGPNTWSAGGVEHHEPGYLDDPTVPKGSKCATYAAVVLQVDTDRWKGVPFMLRAGKGLDERMCEVRVTFKRQAYNGLVDGSPNELVMRIQPDEAIYMKCMNKMPGWQKDRAVPVVLDMTYSKSFPGGYVADAYERMFLNTAKGDGSLFVGAEELVEAWRIFTPVLDEIESSGVQPVVYNFGVRVPAGMDEFSARYGIVMGENWAEHLALHANKFDKLRELFESLDLDKDGRLDAKELTNFAKRFHDGREPPPKYVSRLIERLDTTGSGTLTLQDFERAVVALGHCCVPAAKRDHSSFAG